MPTKNKPAPREATPHMLYTFDSNTGEKIALAFGYVGDEPTAALFVGDAIDPIALLPRSFLEIALQQGWSNPT